jgi:hypothetical protein
MGFIGMSEVSKRDQGRRLSRHIPVLTFDYDDLSERRSSVSSASHIPLFGTFQYTNNPGRHLPNVMKKKQLVDGECQSGPALSGRGADDWRRPDVTRLGRRVTKDVTANGETF